MREWDTRLVVGPNASLTPRQALWFMASVSLVAVVIAVAFAAQGLWPILPFAGLELGALGAALWVSLRRNRYRELVDFEGERLRLGFGWMERGAAAELDWPRAWTRVELVPGRTRNSPSQLWLRYAGQAVRLGRCLTDEERERLGRRLKELLPPVWKSTPVGEPEWSPERLTTGG
ncbi:MAG: DUF2244 domain-containing protein [Stagnimonas sp.]|nr:DUF2244 domain-containing protein [Stagnimonas sp.]